MTPLTRRLAAALGAMALIAILPMPSLAQTESGKITGLVTDQSGGVLPGATVTLKSLGTQATRTATSDASGGYTFSNLLPGPYEVKVELSGFTTRQIKTTLTVGATINVSARLEVGQQTEVITVVGATEGVTVNTSNQEVATTVIEQQLKELPSLTRNAYDFVALSGQASGGDVQNTTMLRGANGFSLNGQRPTSTNTLLDGSANNDEFQATVGQNVPLDSVQEFSVITSNFSAQYGRATGGIVNVATKSGSNEFHGTAYEYFRKSGMSAADFDDNARGAQKQDFTRNQPGFSVGGPLKRDRVFFFASYELTKTTSSANTPFAVPTQELLDAAAPATRSFFAGRLPAGNAGTLTVGQVCGQVGCEDGPFAALGADFPAFAIVNFQAPVDGGAGFGRKRHQAVGRLDFNLSASTTAYARYALEQDDLDPGSVSLSPYDGFNTIQSVKNHNILGSVTHVFSPRLTSQTKVVYNQLRNEQPLGSAGVTPTLFLTGSDVTIQGAHVVFPGYFPTSSGVGIPFGGPQKLLQFYQDFNWVKGKHDMRLGGSYVRIADDRQFGAYQYANEILGFGDPASGLDGLVSGTIQGFSVAINPKVFPPEAVQLPATAPQFFRNNRYDEAAAYFNDSWSVSSRLKLNLGLRWEVFGVQHNTDPSLDSNFYFGQGDNFFQRFRNGGLALAPDSPIGQLWKTDKSNFAPRVGFAYDVSGDGKTSIRGGYGMSYERNFGNVTFNVIQNPPNYGTALLGPAYGTSDTPFQVTLDNLGPLGQPGESPFVSFSLRHIQEDIKTAYAHFWSFSIQRQLGKNVVTSVDYTGSKGVGLYSLGNVNGQGTARVYADRIGIDPFSVSASARLNPIYGSDNMRTNNGKSLYNSVTVGLDGHDIAGSGLSLTAKYTWSKAKDNLSSTFSEGIDAVNLGFLDPYVDGVSGGPGLDYGYSEFDIRHRVTAGGTWELPIAKSSSGATKAALGGWSLNFVFQARSGLPFSIYDCTNQTSGSPCMRVLDPGSLPSGSKNPPAVPGEPNTFNYVDLAAFAPVVGTYVNPLTGRSSIGPFPSNMTERNAFRGPGNWNLDLSLAKRFQLTDKVNLQLRCEAYNVFNHANLYVDGATIRANSNDFVRAYRTDHRNVQVAARLSF